MNEMKAILQFRYLSEVPGIGMADTYHANLVIPNQDIENIALAFLKVLQVAGFTYEAVEAIFNQDINELIYNSNIRFPSKEDYLDEDEDEDENGGGVSLKEMWEQLEKDTDESRTTANQIERKANMQKKFNEFAEDPERVKGFVDQLKDNPELAKKAYRSFLDELED